MLLKIKNVINPVVDFGRLMKGSAPERMAVSNLKDRVPEPLKTVRPELIIK